MVRYGEEADRLSSSDIDSGLTPSRRKLANTDEESLKTFVVLGLHLLLEMFSEEVMAPVDPWGTHPRKQVTQTPARDKRSKFLMAHNT